MQRTFLVIMLLSRLLLLLGVLVASNVAAYKILFYSPRFGKSHLTFVGNLADHLADAGHEVVLYQPIGGSLYENTTGSKYTIDNHTKKSGTTSSKKPVVRTIVRPLDPEIGDIDPAHMSNIWATKNEGLLQLANMLGTMGDRFKRICEMQLRDKKYIELIRKENFDIALSEFFDSCGFAIFRAAGIKKTIVLYASAMPIDDSSYFGVPALPSFVPGWTSGEDIRTFRGRFTNTIFHHVGRHYIMPKFLGATGDAFKVLSPTIPSYQELIAQSSYAFVNSDEFLDFTKPITHKMINIAGVGMKKAMDNTGKLSAEHQKIFDTAKKGVVYFSMGSVAQSHIMPNETKRAFLEAFASFPEINFLWKYEKPEHKVTEGYKNVFEGPWLPQKEILAEPKLLAFFTHGGMNSVTEASFAGVPMAAIPLFGDQPRNAMMVEQRGMGVVIDKATLTTENIAAKIRQIVYDDSYRKTAKRFSKMISAKVLTPEERLIRYTEFACEFDVHDALDITGRHLSTIAFYSLDVYGILLAGLILALTIIYTVLKLALRFVRRLFGGGRKKKAE